MEFTAKQIERARKSLGDSFGCIVSDLFFYHDGFSFTVPTEFDAYKSAHKYQGPGINHTTVKFSPNVNQWTVQIYLTEKK